MDIEPRCSSDLRLPGQVHFLSTQNCLTERAMLEVMVFVVVLGDRAWQERRSSLQ